MEVKIIFQNPSFSVAYLDRAKNQKCFVHYCKISYSRDLTKRAILPPSSIEIKKIATMVSVKGLID